MRRLYWLWLYALWAAVGVRANDGCDGSRCHVTLSDTGELKVKCHNVSDSKQWAAGCHARVWAQVKRLDLSNNTLRHLMANSFSNVPRLERLDLRYNDLQTIESGTFADLHLLQRLDLSHNSLVFLDAVRLVGLNNLMKLKLRENPLTKLSSSIADEVPRLQHVDLRDTQLVCDCHLSWLIKKILSKVISVSPQSKCFAPSKLKDTPLTRVQMGQLTSCMSVTSVVELEPSSNQVVFEGDSLKLRCRASATEGHRMWWAQGDTNLHPRYPVSSSSSLQGYLDVNLFTGHQTDGATIKMTALPDAIESLVEIGSLSLGHSGSWSCVLQGLVQNHSSTINVYVIANDTAYCPDNVTVDNRGTYHFPRTLAGVSVSLPCVMPRGPGSATSGSARHFCDDTGHWRALNTSSCPFVSETTRILENFASLASMAAIGIRESAKGLRNFTSGKNVLRDDMDVVLYAQTVQHYALSLAKGHVNGGSSAPNLVGSIGEIADLIVDMVGVALTLPHDLLTRAEMIDFSCSRLLESLSMVANLSSNDVTSSRRHHVSYHQDVVSMTSFPGLSCSWFRVSIRSTERIFRCNTRNYSSLYNDDEILDAQIQVPSTLFQMQIGSLKAALTTIQFFAYDSAKLFPQRVPGGVGWEVSSPVIGARLSGNFATQSDAQFLQVPDGVYITLRMSVYSHHVLPVWWKGELGGEGGEWTSEGCQIVRMLNSLIVFHCNVLAHFGVAQDMTAAGHKWTYASGGAPFRLSSPVIYIGSGICGICLMASIVTWAAHHYRLKTCDKNRHSFLNTWVALLLVLTLFTVGIRQTHDVALCRCLGLTTHYFSLCVLFWIVVSLTNLYKRVAKIRRPPVQDHLEEEGGPVPPKPVARFYLVGWGIGAIVCGISAAVNWAKYANYEYCFLPWAPGLGAFYAPAAILIFVSLAVWPMIHCVMATLTVPNYYLGETSKGLSDETVGELELLEVDGPKVSLTAQSPEGMSSTSTGLWEDHYGPGTQLLAHLITLMLYVLTWTAAAAATTAPFESIISAPEEVFSICYAICASTLGVFIFIFFCLGRADIWDAWLDRPYLGKSTLEETQANNMPHLSPAVFNNTQMTSMLPGSRALSAQSLASAHNTEKSSVIPSRSVLMHADNVSIDRSCSHHLPVLSFDNMSESGASRSLPEAFYNPRQSGVAKRFFQKQRSKVLKRNNLELKGRDTESDSNSAVYMPRAVSSRSAKNSLCERANLDAAVSFNPANLNTSSAKVNNTNIHVESYGFWPQDIQQMSANKHAAKDPTPELLCVLGPGRGGNSEGGWSTLPRKPSRHTEGPRSPIRRGGSFPCVVEENLESAYYDSVGTTKQKFVGHRKDSDCFESEIIPQVINSSQAQNCKLLYDVPVLGGNNTSMVARESVEELRQQVIGRENVTSAVSLLSNFIDASKSPFPHTVRREREKLGCIGEWEDDDVEEWEDGNVASVIINQMASDSGSDCDLQVTPSHYVSYPQRVCSVSPPDSHRAIVAGCGKSTLNYFPPSPQLLPPNVDTLGTKLFPHVMLSTHLHHGVDSHGTVTKVGANLYDSEFPKSAMVNLDGWDCTYEDEGESDCCSGGGEERASLCDCETSEQNETDCGHSISCAYGTERDEDLSSSGSCSSSSSSGGETSLEPTRGSSPCGSITNNSQSSFDSPLHLPHQNTPDSLSEGPCSSGGNNSPMHIASRKSSGCTNVSLPQIVFSSFTEKSQIPIQFIEKSARHGYDPVCALKSRYGVTASLQRVTCPQLSEQCVDTSDTPVVCIGETVGITSWALVTKEVNRESVPSGSGEEVFLSDAKETNGFDINGELSVECHVDSRN